MNLMKCPRCSQDMLEGHATVRGTLLGFLFVGLSIQHLWFHSQDGSKDVVIQSGGESIAWRCPSCKTIVIAEDGQHTLPQLPVAAEDDRSS